MGVNRCTPGCACPRCGGGGLCFGCTTAAGSYPATYYVTIPALGITSLPMAQDTLVPSRWAACQLVSVLGFAACQTTGVDCSTPATISAAVLITFICTNNGSSPVWQLSVQYYIAQGASCASGTSLSAGDQWRVVDDSCVPRVANPELAPCTYVSTLATGYWQLPNDCTVPGTLSFSGSPGGLSYNYYLGTSATVHS